MIAALYNGYPIVDEGSAAFIEQAAYPHFTPDCTPFYGIFIKVSSLGWSLWFPVMVQALLVSALLSRYLYVVLRHSGRQLTLSAGIWLLITIVSLTGVSWTLCQLMADSFACILLLAVLLLYYDKLARPLLVALYTATAFLAISMHFSHFAVAIICAAAIGFYAYRHRDKVRLARSVWLAAACAGFWLVMCTANAMKHHGFVFARGKNVVLVAKLAETGILKEYLDDKCGAVPLRMCDPAQKIPASQAEFLGSGESPFYKLGGWEGDGAEYSNILNGIFRSPQYATAFARKATVCALKQMVFVVPPAEFPAYGKQSEPYKKIKSYYTDEAREYVTSQQQQGLLTASVFRVIYLLVALLSSLWVWLLPRDARWNKWSGIYGVILLFFVANAVVAGVFTSVSPRLQYRIFWILPATNILFLYTWHYHAKFRLSIKAVPE